MTTQSQFFLLQSAAQDARKALYDYGIEIDVRYNSHRHWAKATERKRLDTLRKRADKCADKFYAYVTSISPRDWSAGVPYHWIVDKLTYEDAVTTGQLSVVPPPAFGYTTHDSERFARALSHVA